MLKEYSISTILNLPSQHIPYYVGIFEGTEDPEIEWPHRHSFYSIIWFTKGSGFYVIDFEEYKIKPNRVFLVNPKQVHNWDYSENSEGYVIIVDEILGANLNINHHLSFIDIDKRLQQLFIPVLSNIVSFNNKSTDVTIDIQYIYSLIDRYAQRSEVTTQTPNLHITKLKELIIENNNTLFTIEQCARSLNLSVNDLNDICKTHVGISAKQYILDLKMTEAKRLLIYSDLNINEIAYRLGFEDSSYFSRIFRKKTSLSPSDFLKKYRNQL